VRGRGWLFEGLQLLNPLAIHRHHTTVEGLQTMLQG
jgi:hypothetical protein